MSELSDVPYMRWAKSEAVKGEFPLTQSAVPALTWDELGMDPATLELYEYSAYGDEQVIAGLVSPWDIDPASAFLGSSTTHVHFCFAASLLAPGDRVLYERPGYLCLLDSLSLLRVDPVPFERRFEDCDRG